MVLSGPSGVGKDAVLKEMKRRDFPLHYSVTLTTRPMRPNEREGVDYHFTTVDRFRAMIAAGELLEWAQVYGNYYGVPRPQIREAMARGMDVLLKVDVQGAATVRSFAPEAVLVFLMPPSFEELRKRLQQRHTEFALDLERRLAAAKREMETASMFDYAVVNMSEKLENAAQQVEAIITAERCRIKRRSVVI